jgi:hypothetical protein
VTLGFHSFGGAGAAAGIGAAAGWLCGAIDERTSFFAKDESEPSRILAIE